MQAGCPRSLGVIFYKRPLDKFDFPAKLAGYRETMKSMKPFIPSKIIGAGLLLGMLSLQAQVQAADATIASFEDAKSLDSWISVNDGSWVEFLKAASS